MKFIKYTIFFIYFITFITGYYINFLTLGSAWKKIHVNSLIGTQKIFEKYNFKGESYINLWYDIVLPILLMPIISLAVLIFFLIHIFILYK